MIKLIITAIALTLLSFGTQEQKKVTITFTPEEVEVIYGALGKLPAEQVELLRAKIATEYRKQIIDTTTKKK